MFAVNIPLVLLMLIAVLIVVPTSKDPESSPLDPVGGVLSIVGLAIFLFVLLKIWRRPFQIHLKLWKIR